MTLRIEIQPDSSIEIMRPGIKDGSIRFLNIDGLERALRIIRYLLRREIDRVKRDRFVSQLDKECKAVLVKEVKARKHGLLQGR